MPVARGDRNSCLVGPQVDARKGIAHPCPDTLDKVRMAKEHGVGLPPLQPAPSAATHCAEASSLGRARTSLTACVCRA